MNYNISEMYDLEDSTHNHNSILNKDLASISSQNDIRKIQKKRAKKLKNFRKNIHKNELRQHKIVENTIKESKIKRNSGLYILLKRELINFCQNTTMRGMPRIIKAQSRNIRMLWISFVVILFIGLLLSMLFLTRQYLEYNVIHPPVILLDQEPPFPSISVCNLRPISRSGLVILKKRNWRNPRQFGSEVHKYVSAKWYGNESTRHYYTQLTTAMSMNGYLESIPLSVLESLGHSLNDLVIYCLIMYNVGSKLEVDNCTNLGSWTKTTHAFYLNCYSLTVRPYLKNHVKTVYMYLYLDENMKLSTCGDCFIRELKSQLSGALAVVHTYDTYPDINQESVNLQPGTLTEFNLKFILNKNKEPPYGRCSRITETHIKLHNHNYIYSENACRSTTIQKEVNDVCKCNSIEYPVFNLSLPFCTALSSFISFNDCKEQTDKNGHFISNETCDSELLKVYNNLDCKINITKKYKSDVVKSCTVPCSSYSYASDRSTSTWPTKSFQLTWIKSEMASELRKRSEFFPYLHLINLTDEGKENEALEILDKLNILERNLLGIMINRQNNKVHVVEEKEVLSLTSYLSQAGGLLSIFVGLSMISIVEVIELLIHCFEAFRTNYSKKHRYSMETSVVDNLPSENNISPINRTPTENQVTLQNTFYQIL